jgi:hypothetical protein
MESRDLGESCIPFTNENIMKTHKTRNKKRYKSKSYRAFVDRLYKKYPAVDIFAECMKVHMNMPGLMRRILSPDAEYPKTPTPVTDGFNLEFRKYDRRQSYDHLCLI